MMANPLPDPSTPFGERVLRRLREERVIWLTTVDSSGTPQPNPVWFFWDGETLLVYNRPDAKRLQHIRRNPRVSLNFDSDGSGGDIVVLSGEARVNPDGAPASMEAAYLEKYRAEIPEIDRTPESLAAEYSVALRISITKVRGF
ncbi:MAG TPA: TIGR03667 family PPOX class F420-dependent oxidoreductase [Chloroflexota bacterium]|jgi:PPOX class probable F420-dependent enzyme|nr:TIGR03667 family PPOX class F420-dependent oxidoreductase [Chloroflexota bacterium]